MNCIVAGRVKEIALDQLVKVLDRVPLVSGIKNDLVGLRSLLYERRAPRIVVLGLGGSGRSTLLRSLVERGPATDTLRAEHGEWVRIEHEGSAIRWLEIDVSDDAARSQWKRALDERVPDLVLLIFDSRSAPRAIVPPRARGHRAASRLSGVDPC